MSGRSNGPPPRGPGRSGSRDVIATRAKPVRPDRSPDRSADRNQDRGADRGPDRAKAAPGGGGGKFGPRVQGAASKAGGPRGASAKSAGGKFGPGKVAPSKFAPAKFAPSKPSKLGGPGPRARAVDPHAPQEFTDEADGFIGAQGRGKSAPAKPRAKYTMPPGRRRTDAEALARAAQPKAPKAAAAPRRLPLRVPTDPAAAAAFEALRAAGTPDQAAAMVAQHRTGRACLGVPGARIDTLAREWRTDLAGREAEGGEAARLALAAALWDSGAVEARIAAAKLLTQAKIEDDGAVWALIASWIPQIDVAVIGDAVAAAGARRVLADPSRLAQVARWVKSAHVPTRLAALAVTLPIAKDRLPGEAGARARTRILGWTATLGADAERGVQKAAGAWLAALSRHDPDAVRALLAEHGTVMKPVAVREAARLLGRD